MNQDQALAIIDDALAQLRLTRVEHVRLQTAMELIRKVAGAFSQLAREKAAEEAAKKQPAPETAKDPIDETAKSEA